MENFDIFQSLKNFMQQIKELSPHDHVVVNYLSLLNKITSTQTIPINRQCESICNFLEKNKMVLTVIPLALNTYELEWLPLKSSSSTFNIDLMPAFSAATLEQAVVLHCHLLKIASLVYFDDPQYGILLDELEKTVNMNRKDIEKEIVDTMFGLVKEIDVNSFDKNEPEEFVSSFLTSKLGSILPMLKQPGIKWKVLFRYMFEVVDKLGKERGISDPDVDNLLTSLKDSDYEVSAVYPKIFEIVKKLRLKLPFNITETIATAENAEHVSSD